MASITKLALTQINTRLASENEALRKQVEDLQLSVTIAYDEVHALGEQLADLKERPTKPAAPQWQQDRAKAMAAAREMAMRVRMTVKV